MSREGAESLIAAVAKAMGKRKLNVNNLEDMLLIQKGCFILNKMGALHKYNFRLYIRGPYSSDLAEDCYQLLKGGISYETSVPSDCIEKLSSIMRKGARFVEAYATLELAAVHNPKMRKEELVEFVIKMAPPLKEKIEEASGYLNPAPSAI
jgi:uncharacterized protein YwgA